MGLFSRYGRPPAPVDPALPDAEWLAASQTLFRKRIEPFYGSPETMAKGGEERYDLSDYGAAMFFYAKSIDMLHTAYGFAGMERRQPSSKDTPIIDGYTAALALSLKMHPGAPVAECVREITHRLRSISSECDRVGLPSGIYRVGLDAMAATAPDVPVDDVLWT